MQWSTNDAEQGLAITAPPDLQQERLQQLPREVRSSNDRYELCADPVRVKQAIEQARQAKGEDETWPQLHYLWPQHPIVEWLVDRVITLFGRHRAPVIQSHSSATSSAFVMLGLVPNRKGQPLLVDWQVACRYPGQPFTLEPYEAFVQRAGLKAGQVPNPGLSAPLQDMQAALPEAVACMRQHMVQRQAAFAVQMQQRLQGTLADLER